MNENKEMERLENGMFKMERQKRTIKGGTIEVSKVRNGKWKETRQDKTRQDKTRKRRKNERQEFEDGNSGRMKGMMEKRNGKMEERM